MTEPVDSAKTETHFPARIVLHQQSHRLEIEFDNGATYFYPFEFLRVFSPSAEVRGHGMGNAVLQPGKRDVTIVRLEPVGHYALKPTFSDGHASGLYSWGYLYQLGEQQASLWQNYLQQLMAAGASRTSSL